MILTGVVVISGVFSFYQEHKSYAIMESFKRLMPQVDGDRTPTARHLYVVDTVTAIPRLLLLRFFTLLPPRNPSFL